MSPQIKRNPHQLTTLADGSGTITVKCCECNARHTFYIKMRDYAQWQAGMLIQNAFPYLSDDDREILISGICGKCFDRMFAEEE